MRKTESGWEIANKTLALAVSLIVIFGFITSAALNYAATQHAIADKVDKVTYTEDLRQLHLRAALDSVAAAADRGRIAEIKLNTDEISRRLTQFICSRSPQQEYCR